MWNYCSLFCDDNSIPFTQKSICMFIRLKKYIGEGVSLYMELVFKQFRKRENM